jgi:hypothetical protein
LQLLIRCTPGPLGAQECISCPGPRLKCVKYTQRNIFRRAGQSLAGVSVFFVKVCIFHNQKMHVYLIRDWKSNKVICSEGLELVTV